MSNNFIKLSAPTKDLLSSFIKEKTSMKLYIIIFALTGLVVSSCSKSDCADGFDTTNFSLNKEYCLNENESIIIDSLLESRCPANVECVWAGQVNLFITIKINNASHQHEIIYKNEENVQIFNDISGYTLSIEAITPYPVTSNDNTPEEYTVKMKIK